MPWAEQAMSRGCRDRGTYTTHNPRCGGKSQNLLFSGHTLTGCSQMCLFAVAMLSGEQQR